MQERGFIICNYYESADTKSCYKEYLSFWKTRHTAFLLWGRCRETENLLPSTFYRLQLISRGGSNGAAPFHIDFIALHSSFGVRSRPRGEIYRLWWSLGPEIRPPVLAGRRRRECKGSDWSVTFQFAATSGDKSGRSDILGAHSHCSHVHLAVTFFFFLPLSIIKAFLQHWGEYGGKRRKRIGKKWQRIISRRKFHSFYQIARGSFKHAKKKRVSPFLHTPVASADEEGGMQFGFE